MNNSNRFIQLSVKQQLALCQIGKDLIEIDTKIDESYINFKYNKASTNGNVLPRVLIKIFDFFKLL